MNAIITTSEPGEGSTPRGGSLVNLIARAAGDPSIDVAKLEALLQMQERVLRNQAKHEFNQAMAAVAGELEPVKKDARNPHIGNRYAKLEAIDAALRPIYSRHGFSVRNGSEPSPDGRVHVTCTVAHAGGHSETLGLSAPLDAVGTGGRASKTGVQALGSTVTYLRRYLLCMAFNVTFADDDDDGEGAGRGRGAHTPRGEGFTPRGEPAPSEPAVAQERGDNNGDDALQLDQAREWAIKVTGNIERAPTAERVREIRKAIGRKYAQCRIAFPAIAAQIDEAELQAIKRIGAAKHGGEVAPGVEIAGEERMEA